MKALWRGTVTIFSEDHEPMYWQGTVKAETPADAAERAVRLALSGQPRRAEATIEVEVRLSKEVST